MKKYLELLNEFANDLSTVRGGGIDVVITDHSVEMKPRPQDGRYYATPDQTVRYEDGNYVADIIKGAQSLLYYLERNGYVIGKKVKRRKK